VACTFFIVYDKSKKILAESTNINASLCHMIAAALAESSANLLRNPFEVNYIL
jgi:hypothetical protein